MSVKCEDCGTHIGRELTPKEKQEKFEKEMAEKIKAQKELGHCGSVGGGLNFVCEMDEGHIGKCKVFSTQDGTVIADWWKDPCPECEKPMANTKGDLWSCSCGLTMIQNEVIGKHWQGRDTDCPECRGHMRFDGELFICYSCNKRIPFEDLFYKLPKKEQRDIAYNWGLHP